MAKAAIVKYVVYHTVEGSAGACSTARGWKEGETDDLEQAIRISEELATSGRCGYVVRSSDGAVLGADGTWAGGKNKAEQPTQNFILSLPRSLHRDLQAAAAEENASLSEIVIQALSGWLAGRKR